eukprot:207304_1
MAALMPSHSASSFGHVASSSSQPIFRFGSATRASSVPAVFECARHRFEELWEDDHSETGVLEWRMRERMRTGYVALVMCMNISVDPPDVVKTEPCAREECWINPLTISTPRALETIGKALQTQYRHWQPKATYKQCLDPTVEIIEKLCLSLRRAARNERVLFHYNGHGVPMPTANGEIWFFNTTYTQYIPLALSDLRAWVGTPAIYVFDCHSAGQVIDAFRPTPLSDDLESVSSAGGSTSGDSSCHAPSHAQHAPAAADPIVLAACGARQTLPTNPRYPADLFTACLTTPLKIGLRWFALRSQLTNVSPELIDKIPGRPNDRKTVFGELNWIFTAITDTIAWNVLPRDMFQRLFRQDLLVASLFRNFLLADRIMRALDCQPVSIPALPRTHAHSLWRSWDLAVEHCLCQLERCAEDPKEKFKPSSFFEQQLTAFEVWLEFGNESKKPEQLPVVLQVLLSQVHRLRALKLLARFLDKGAWAVNLSLSVGIFPYVLKLLQSRGTELREVLVFIWGKLVALDPSCQVDLIKEKLYFEYFVSHLRNQNISYLQRSVAVFVLVSVCNNFQAGQRFAMESRARFLIRADLDSQNPILRRWAVLFFAKLWERFPDARGVCMEDEFHTDISKRLDDKVPEVRAAAVYALGGLIDGPPAPVTLRLGGACARLASDGSPLVRMEVTIALSNLAFQDKFEFAIVSRTRSLRKSTNGVLPEFKVAIEEKDDADRLRRRVWKSVLLLCRDPVPAVADAAQALRRYIAFRVDNPQATRVVSSPNLALLAQDAHSPSLGARSSLHAPISPEIRADHMPGSPKGRPERRSTATAGGILRKVKTTTQNMNELVNLPPTSPEQHTSPPVPAARAHRQASDLALPRPMPMPMHTKAFPPGQLVCSIGMSPLAGHRKRPSSDSSSSDPRDTDEHWQVPSSTFFDWSCEYFRQPLMVSDMHSNERQRPPSSHPVADPCTPQWDVNDDLCQSDFDRADHLTSDLRSRRLAARQRQRIESIYDRHKLDDQVAIFSTESNTISNVVFHPFESTLVASDNKSRIYVWDVEAGARVHVFSNQNPHGSRVTDLSVVNEHSRPMLLCASDDGFVRLWNKFDQKDSQTLSTSFMGLERMSKLRNPGLIVHWNQASSSMLISGSTNVIRLWDAQSERAVRDIPVGTEKGVTSMCSGLRDDCSVIFAGCGDGSVRVFDLRIPESRVSTNERHNGWVVKVYCRENQLLSAGIRGDISLSSLRRDPVDSMPTKPIQLHENAPLNAFAVHDYLPIYASGSVKQFVRISGSNFGEINTIRYHDGFLGHRIGGVSSLAFHRNKLLLAVGTLNAEVSVYSGDTTISGCKSTDSFLDVF